jgi:hypothetical protein
MNARESENYLAISRSSSALKSVEISWAVRRCGCRKQTGNMNRKFRLSPLCANRKIDIGTDMGKIRTNKLLYHFVIVIHFNQAGIWTGIYGKSRLIIASCFYSFWKMNYNNKMIKQFVCTDFPHIRYMTALSKENISYENAKTDI